MKNVNIVCTSKPGDGLLRYSYEHCCYLNELGLGIEAKLIIIPNKKHTQQDYIDALKEQYIKVENVIFDFYIPKANDVTLVMGRSMITLAHLDYIDYNETQRLTLHQLFNNKIISVYSENHPKEYDLALKRFNPKKVTDLCDFDVYKNGVGHQFEKIINFSIYKSFKHDIKYQYLFLGTNKTYYEAVEKVISNNWLLYQSHGIITYPDKYLNPQYNNLNVPVKNLLGSFETYAYTKPNFDPAPRIIQECKYFGKKVLYLRDKEIQDGGPVYWKREANCLTDKRNEDKISNLLAAIYRM
jgi:hypothetical protein